MLLLLLDLQHHHQAGILPFQVVEQESHEVIDDVGLVALSACVHINGYTGVFQRDPLEAGKDLQLKIYKPRNVCRKCDEFSNFTLLQDKRFVTHAVQAVDWDHP